MSLPDNRMRFPAPLIDFANDVGITGQDHDNYPAPGQQARYDHMRIVIQALLSNQSSENPPNEYREGTLWFDLKDLTMKVRQNGEWVDLSQSIKLENTDISNSPITLQDWYNTINENIESFKSEVFFHGIIESTNAALIPIPSNLLGKITTISRPYVYINGILINPAFTKLESGPNPTIIEMPNNILTKGSTFVVIIKSISNANFNVQPVTI